MRPKATLVIGESGTAVKVAIGERRWCDIIDGRPLMKV